MKSPTTRRRVSRQEGSVLVAVLAIILLLAFLVTKILDEAIEDLEYRALFSEPIDLRSYAFSMLEVSLATIQEVALIDEGKLYAPEQGWANPLAYAGISVPNGWDVSIRIEDESGKLPLNTMDEALLNRLLEEHFEFDFGTARELSSMLLDWIDPDDNRRLNGAESADYLRRRPPYRAANAPLQSLEELRWVEVWENEFFNEEGSPNARFHELAGMVSVIHSGPVNLNSAPAAVLELLALEDGFDQRSVFDNLERETPYLTNLPPAANERQSQVQTNLLRVTVSVRRGDLPYTITALVSPVTANSTPGTPSRGSAPGQRREDLTRTGSQEEQDALNYPFRILNLSEYRAGAPDSAEPARYSEIDIAGRSGSSSDF